MASVIPIDAYTRKLKRTQEAYHLSSRLSRDIYPIPAIKDRVRREAGIASFPEFCKIYLSDQFTLAWSKYHFLIAERIQTAVTHGGLFAFAMPRATGKTTISRAGVLWAILSGHCNCVVLLAAAEKSAERHLKFGLKKTLLKNRLLLEDFPHAIYPFIRTDGEPRAALGQLYKGEKTFIDWHASHITFGWIPEEDSLSSGAIIETMGMTAEIRGPLYTQPDGTQIRPQLVIADDVQTRESAKSPSQSRTRLETLCGDVAYLAGPASPVAVVSPCTVIYEGDLADQILNPDTHPEWNPVRTKMVESFPENMALWDQYAEKARELLRSGKPTEEQSKILNRFYLSRRDEMDKGAVVSWPERFAEHEVSAIQHAMNLKIRDEAAFYSECQNEPIVIQDDFTMLSADEICAKQSGYKRGVVPDDCSVITAFTDIQDEHLFWMICAWTPDFTGYIIDYGAWPDQKRTYFTRHDVIAGRKKLSIMYDGDEGAITLAALNDLADKLCGSKYVTASGKEMSLEKWGIDIGFRKVFVTSFAVQSKHKSLIVLTRGMGVRAINEPLSQNAKAKEWHTTHGEWYWADRPGPAKDIRADVNYWKCRAHTALVRPAGSRGAIHLFKAETQIHRMIADHLLAEKPVKNEARGRAVREWVALVGRDNEGLDCLVGNMVIASVAGIINESEQVRPKRRPRMTLSAMAKAARKTG